MYLYQGNNVRIPRGSEVTKAFRPGNVFSECVQGTLDRVEPWEQGEDPIEGFELPRRIGARVVRLAATETPVWAVNVFHKARKPGLSPFLRLTGNDARGSVQRATLELSGMPDCPILTRVYPGDYTPPLPWMKTAENTHGGPEAGIDYWHTHAYILRGDDLVLHDPPDWYDPTRRGKL